MNLPLSQIWFIVGAVLLLLELLVPLPTFLVAGALGIAAMAVALAAIAIPFLPVQLALWVAISGAMVWYSRRFIPRDSNQLKDAVEGITLTEILPGESGRVQYEGGSWKARCDDPKISIAPQEKVYILRRQGNTLIVVPEHWLHD